MHVLVPMESLGDAHPSRQPVGFHCGRCLRLCAGVSPTSSCCPKSAEKTLPLTLGEGPSPLWFAPSCGQETEGLVEGTSTAAHLLTPQVQPGLAGSSVSTQDTCTWLLSLQPWVTRGPHSVGG